MTHKGLIRQGSLYVFGVLCILAATGDIALRLPAQTTVQSCTEYTQAIGETFATTDHKDAANSSVDGWSTSLGGTSYDGQIALTPLGSNFLIGGADSLGRHIYMCAAGDFNSDGYPDLIGLDITNQMSNPVVNPQSQLRFIKNLYPTNQGAKPLFSVDMTTAYDTWNNGTGPCALTVGDYNGDGKLDFFFMRNTNDEYGYTNFRAAMYINCGTATVPNFKPYNTSPSLDFTAKFQAVPIYLYWAANHLCSVDIDKDGDIDILIASQDRIYILRNPGKAQAGNISKWTISELTTSSTRTGYSAIPGTSAITACDFDNDGDYDILCGSCGTYNYLVYYKNDGTGHFTRSTITIPDATCVGAVGLLGTDFTGDGLADVFVATDAAYRWSIGQSSAQSRIWFLRNKGIVGGNINWLFKCLDSCTSPTTAGDIDMSTPLDYDHDGDMDVIIADANHSGDYYYIENELAGVYELYGQAQSTNLSAAYVNASLHAITRIRVTSITQGIRHNASSTGLAVKVLFSNNGGHNWEPYTTFSGSGIKNSTNLPWYDFENFGTDLRFKIVLTATADKMDDYTNASYETPYVDDIQVEFVYVDRREYSRASAAATLDTSGGGSKEIVIASSFVFPGWQGQLRAYDVSGLSAAAGTASTLQTISTSDLDAANGRSLVTGTSILWDGGQMLADRSADSRTVYTSIRAGGVLSNPLSRQSFAQANESTLAAFLQDYQNDNAGLIDFIRGKNRAWKLGDINHSTPVVVGPPTGNADLMGDGYASFKTTYASRAKVIYVGSNDGMVHCFNAATGDELWGYIPYNLLPKLRNMYAVDIGTGDRYYNHDIYCDATPAVADVKVGGTWKTVLITGQGQGKGSTIGGGLNYYWALDVSDPSNPQPLWEISPKDGSGVNTMGETWSTPAIGRLGTGDWVAFMGSGYNNDKDSNGNLISLVPGTYFYAVSIADGSVIATRTVDDVDTNSDAVFTGDRNAYKYANIRAAIPGSPTAVDLGQDGTIDQVYVGDLDGRLYRLNVTATAPANWTFKAIYTDCLNYPIITKPAVWLNSLEGTSARPHIYFGTGGDDSAPNDRDYSFVGIIDYGQDAATVQWYLGVPARLNVDASGQRGTLGTGSKVWADPVIADQIVYFSTLQGSIEAVNPCSNLGSAGQLYARYLRYSSAIPVGTTAFKSLNPIPPEYLTLQSKARQAVTVGETQKATDGSSKRAVYVQEYDSTLEKLGQPTGASLRIKSWREVYRIIR